MLTGPDFGLVLTKLKAVWVLTMPDVSENRGAFILLSHEEGSNAVLRNSPNARDISGDTNLRDTRRQIVAHTRRYELVRSSTMKMEVSGFSKISYSKIIPEDRNVQPAPR